MNYRFFKLCLLAIMVLNINASENIVSITSPKNGSTVNTHQPIIKGKVTCRAQPVHVKLDGVSIGDAPLVICRFGTSIVEWNIVPPKPLRNGAHTVEANIKVNGKVITAKSTFTVKADPLFITIDSPINNQAISTNEPTISGTATFGDTVSINVKSSLVNIFATTNVNSSGTWSFKINQVLPDGTYTITASTSFSGRTDTVTSTFVVNTTKSIVITSPRNNSTIVNDNKKLIIKGTIPVGLFSTIKVKLDGINLGFATLDASSTNWSITTKAPLSNGTHNIVAIQENLFGVLGRATSIFTLVNATGSNSSGCGCN